MSETNQGSKKTIYLVIILILLLINLVGAYFLFKGSKDLEAEKTEVVNLKDDLAGLQAEFNSQLTEIESLKGKNADLDAILLEREAEIKQHLDEIQKWKNQSSYNKSQLNKLKDKIVEFESERIEFLSKIDDLTAQNEELIEVKDQLEKDLTSQKETTAILSEEKKYLSNKFELGSLLQADELTAGGVKVKSNGAERELNKVKALDKILVCYQTGENKVREDGKVAMQLRLINPKGETMFVQNEGSGTFTSKENGEEIRYSKQAEFDYSGSNKKICLDWAHNITDAGEYTAEIYQEGYLVGIKKFELK